MGTYSWFPALVTSSSQFHGFAQAMPLEHLPLSAKNKHILFFKVQLRTLPEELETLFAMLPLQISLTVAFSLSVSSTTCQPLAGFFTFAPPEVSTMPDEQ